MAVGPTSHVVQNLGLHLVLTAVGRLEVLLLLLLVVLVVPRLVRQLFFPAVGLGGAGEESWGQGTRPSCVPAQASPVAPRPATAGPSLQTSSRALGGLVTLMGVGAPAWRGCSGGHGGRGTGTPQFYKHLRGVKAESFENHFPGGGWAVSRVRGTPRAHKTFGVVLFSGEKVHSLRRILRGPCPKPG